MIKFNELEQKIIDLLLNVVRAKTSDTTIRIAGGFVRDRLLGFESNDIDIDIAVSNMSGASFAQLVIDYMRENNYELEQKEPTIIKNNPEQSKHLEVGLVKIFGIGIDFVNLRKETYTDSRIPTIEFGSPYEDSMRRDFTINALFYNLNTNEIEDFTGNGLNDLKNGIIRTTSAAKTIFLDDPLRILRSCRFSARYNFSLDPEIVIAANNPEVQEAFRNKLSAERIWKELAGEQTPDGWKAGILNGPNANVGARLLGELGLRDLLFKPNENELKELGIDRFTHWDKDQNSLHHNLNIWQHSLKALDYLVEHNTETDKEELLVKNLSMLLHDFGKISCCQLKEDGYCSYLGHEDDSSRLSEYCLTKLRAPIFIVERVKLLTQMHMLLHVLDDNPSNKSLRKYLRKLGSNWRISLEISIADVQGKLNVSTNANNRYIEFKKRLEILEKEIQTNGNKTLSIIRPINGFDLIELGIKPGPIMKILFDKLDEELLENPNLSKEESLIFISDLLDNNHQ